MSRFYSADIGSWEKGRVYTFVAPADSDALAYAEYLAKTEREWPYPSFVVQIRRLDSD